ncbi:MAG: flagellar basal body rod protein FlgB [Ruminococcus sp.]|nr:flagellar basal body rod protein FlgB [Ruminococcus sp.]
MLFDSLQFKAMESGIQAMSLKQQIHVQNLANIDTPDYKVQDMTFRNVLEDKVDLETGKKSNEYSFRATVTTEDRTEVLIDGNNVDLDAEQLELYSAYIQQAAIIQKMNSVINDYRYVLTNANFK